MTREEAINVLNDYDINSERNTAEEVAEAHEMAIKALQQQPSENEKIIRISKGTLKARTSRYVIYDVEWLKEHFNTTEAKIYGQPNEDCISRKEAIDALKQQAENMLCWSGRYTEQRKGILTAINIVSDLLSVTPQSKAEPQQKTGHWIYSYDVNTGEITWSKCSKCGNEERGCAQRRKYCPECGAKMQEGDK